MMRMNFVNISPVSTLDQLPMLPELPMLPSASLTVKVSGDKERKMPAAAKVVRCDFAQGKVSVDGRPFPLGLTPSSAKDATGEDLLGYLRQERESFRKTLDNHGAILLRGWHNTPEDFSRLMSELFETEHFDMACSAGPRTEVAKGVFTANEAPPQDVIPFHHEMAQCDRPPAYIAFYCEVPATSGGATPVIESYRVAHYLRTKYPEPAEKLATVGVRYLRVMPESTDSTSALGKSWKLCLGVNTKGAPTKTCHDCAHTLGLRVYSFPTALHSNPSHCPAMVARITATTCTLPLQSLVCFSCRGGGSQDEAAGHDVDVAAGGFAAHGVVANASTRRRRCHWA